MTDRCGAAIRRVRPALALTLVPLVLLLFMELVYFKDPYGTEFYRMNTVFKSVTMAFTLLAVTAPVLLGWLRRRRYWLASAGAVVVLAAGLPQLAALAGRAFEARPQVGAAWPGWPQGSPRRSPGCARSRAAP